MKLPIFWVNVGWVVSSEYLGVNMYGSAIFLAFKVKELELLRVENHAFSSSRWDFVFL